MGTTSRIRHQGLLVSAFVLAGAVAAAAQIRNPQPTVAEERNAGETRERLQEILRDQPPVLSQVLRLDPSLLSRPDYLAPYPTLAAFIAQHPEIVHAPAYFVGDPEVRTAEARMVRTMNLVEEILGGLAFLVAFTMLVFLVAWLIRTMLADRRWQRLTKIQTEAHTKLFERLSSHDDLLEYLQSPSGRRFLESAPAPIDVGPGHVHAPIGRILWSTQAGLVLVAVGIGLLLAKNRVIDELSTPLFVVGVVAIALGIGFAASAVAAYLLSQKLGLLDVANAHDA